MKDSLIVSAGVIIPASELSWTAVRASGPGGQNVNKVSSKVELRFDVKRSAALDEATKARLLSLAGSRIDAEGTLVLVSQATRDRPRNLEDARRKLAELVRQALERPKNRKPTAPSRAAKRSRMEDKRRHAQKKRERKVSEE
jgi:ribosome-associated protein